MLGLDDLQKRLNKILDARWRVLKTEELQDA